MYTINKLAIVQLYICAISMAGQFDSPPVLKNHIEKIKKKTINVYLCPPDILRH